MDNRTGLEVADVVGRVVNQLQVPDAALVRLLQPFELPVQEIEPFHIGNDRGLPGFMGRLEVGSGKRAA
jgi:hypothetical protein